jgi:hypothetical protein
MNKIFLPLTTGQLCDLKGFGKDTWIWKGKKKPLPFSGRGPLLGT